MAYRLKRQRATAKELARVVAKEFEKASQKIAHGAPRAEAIHEARKSIKKIRAVLRLLQKNLGENYRVENRRLRAQAHQLSWLRDVDAMAETMASMRSHYARVVTRSSFAAVCRGLAARKRQTVARLNPGRLLARAARELRRSAETTVPRIRAVANLDAVRAGMRRGYRRARKALARVDADPCDARFHAWRRRVKDHWYHVRLFGGFNASARGRARRLKRLETWLGDDHNLVLLRTTILSAPARFGTDRSTALVLGCDARYQTTLRRRALKLGHRLFARTPQAFQRSVDRWWRG
jgi:CHAD domain-containing protein